MRSGKYRGILSNGEIILSHPAAVLLLTNQLEVSPKGGREMLCKLNHDVLIDIHSNSLIVLELTKRSVSGIKSFINAFRGHIDGVNNEAIDVIFHTIRSKSVGSVFVDGSNFGELVHQINKEFPQIKVFTFFHNVEARFFWGLWRLNNTMHALGVLLANVLAERKAVKFSDKIICLSVRDSGLLKKLYGRGATHIAPMVLQDMYHASFEEFVTNPPEPFALFVGGVFYANRTGIEWFVREVVPQIQLPIYIVGRGFEVFRAELEVPGKVVVVGAVESLAGWYQRAQFVIAPILTDLV